MWRDPLRPFGFVVAVIVLSAIACCQADRLDAAELEAALPSDAQLAADKLARYRTPPWGACQFVQEELHATPDPWQEEALKTWVDPTPGPAQRISLQAAAGVGKSAIEAMCGWHFLACYGSIGEHPKGFVTGITHENLRDNLWAEFEKWRQRSDYLKFAFRHTAQRIFAADHPNTWFLAPRNWPKTGNADAQGATLSGLHGRYVAAFIDESGAIPSTVLRAAEQALSDRPIFGKVLQAGNPISLDGMLYAAANMLRAQWTIVIVTNDPDDPRCSPRGDKEWARTQIATYGRENAWVKSYILGQFPPASLNALLGIEDVQLAMDRRLKADQFNFQEKRLGVDVARFGDDRTVIFPRQGMRAFRPVVMRGASTTDIAARVFTAKARWRSQREFIDDTGHWGHGVIDNLRAARLAPEAVVFHAPALNPRYKNRRAEMHIELAKAVKGGLQLPTSHPDLVAELTTPTYTFVNGVFQLEDKEFVKKRLGRSPDLADGLALTYAMPDMPNEVLDQLQGTRTGQVDTEYDPFAQR
jgi:hypothetical protein